MVDRPEKDSDNGMSRLEQSILEKAERLTGKAIKGQIRESGCYAACPECITRSCTLLLGHYSPHRCSEGHTY